MRKDGTTAEKLLWENIRRNKLGGYAFRRQHPIGRYITDFYCCKTRLVIEIDGNIHERDDINEYDMIREKEIKSKAINILRFTNDEIYSDMANVLLKIKSELQRLS